MNESVQTLEVSPLALHHHTNVLNIPDSALQVALVAAQAADDRKADNIRVVQVTAVSYLADYFVVASGFSPVQVKAIARAIEAAVQEQCDRAVLRQEGLSEGRWILQDYGDVVVHLFMPQEREYYNLEAFWGHGQALDWQAQIAEATAES
jgi:ribosome-associated protein